MKFDKAQSKKLHFVRLFFFWKLLRGPCTTFGKLCPSRIQRFWRKMKKWANFGLVSANPSRIQQTLARQQEREFFRRLQQIYLQNFLSQRCASVRWSSLGFSNSRPKLACFLVFHENHWSLQGHRSSKYGENLVSQQIRCLKEYLHNFSAMSCLFFTKKCSFEQGEHAEMNEPFLMKN